MKLRCMTNFALIAGLGLSGCNRKAPSEPPATEAPAAEAPPPVIPPPAPAPPPPVVAPSPAAAAPQADDLAATELREHHRHHHHGGITQFIAMGLDTLGTDEAKRPQVEQIQSDLRGCMKPARETEKGLLQVISDGVAAGKIDTAKVDSAIVELHTNAASVHGCGADALNKLHALLSPAERQALVDKVQAHWHVWREVNHEAEGGGKEHGGRLAELVKELSLTPEQTEKMSTALHAAIAPLAEKFDAKKGEAHVQGFATAFAGETFDAKANNVDANSDLAAHGARRMAIFYETVTPLLTPEQRTNLAGHLREHASQQPTTATK